MDFVREDVCVHMFIYMHFYLFNNVEEEKICTINDKENRKMIPDLINYESNWWNSSESGISGI